MTIRKSSTDNGFIIFKDQLSILKAIPNEQLGEAIKLLLENFDDLPELKNIAYEIIAINIRRYREQSKISSEMGKKGGNKTLMGTDKGRDNPTDNPTDKLQYITKQEYKIKDEIEKYRKGLIDRTKYKLCYKGVVSIDWKPTNEDYENSQGYPYSYPTEWI